MTLNSSDLQWFKSATGDSAGGAISATQITGSADNNLWTDILEAPALAGGTRYSKVFLHNDSGADAMTQPVIWLSTAAIGVTEHLGMGWDDTDDDDTLGGNITAMTANAIIQLLSDGADTRQVDVTGVSGGGTCVTERITLNGTTPVSTGTTFASLLGVHTIGGVSGTRIITFKQGVGGTVRGTIGINMTAAWLWVAAPSKGAGLRYANLAAGANAGVWRRQVWAAATAMQRPNPNAITAEEV